MSKKLKRRWFQFSLRTVILVVTAICVLLFLLTNSAKKQKEAVAWVEAQGGSVDYEWSLDAKGDVDRRIQRPEINKPIGWLIDTLGDDYFYDVVRVWVGSSTVKPPLSDISALSRFPKITELWLTRINVNDLEPLANMKKLERLLLNYSQVSDLSALAGLKHLEDLDLHHTQVNDLSSLAEVKSLKSLDLAGTPVSDLSALAGLKNLEHLNLDRTRRSKGSGLFVGGKTQIKES